MKVLSAEFVTSAAAGDRIPRDGVPQIPLAGRSNVGKSSLINALCRAKVARTSAAPGKTRLGNFYRVTLDGGPGGPGLWSVYLVDLPGYGYARGGAEGAVELRAVAETYFQLKLRAPAFLASALLLIDARHVALDSDRAAARWLDELGVDYDIVATKIDKLSRAERARTLNTLRERFGQAAVAVSAQSGEGLEDLWKNIATIVRNR